MADIVPADQLQITSYPERPKGGQHVGSWPYGVRIEHVDTGLVACCMSSRSQHRNREIAMHMIEAALTHPGFGRG